MPVASQEEQFKFLISCIRYSDNGKVDFAEVAKECQIVSKGAAAKRYERMMKYHGLYQPASGAREKLKPTTTKEPNSPAPTPSAANTTDTKVPESPIARSPSSSSSKRPRKKYKCFDGGSCNLATDDDEGLIRRGAQGIKAEKEAYSVIKEEHQGVYGGTAGFQFPLMEQDGVTTGGEDCGDMLSDFLQPQDFERPNGSDRDAFGFSHGFAEVEHQPLGSKNVMGQNSVVLD